MTQEEIISMAREAGMQAVVAETADAVERFAKLVAEKEREECAILCEQAPEPDGYDLAERIRARGQQ